MSQRQVNRVPLLLWPFAAVWDLLAIFLGLTGRLVAGILGLVLMIIGAILTITVVGAVVGIPVIIVGFLLVLRSLF